MHDSWSRIQEVNPMEIKGGMKCGEKRRQRYWLTGFAQLTDFRKNLSLSTCL
jgi:hypothetical protein